MSLLRTAAVALTGVAVGLYVGYRTGKVRQAMAIKAALQTDTEPQTAKGVIDDYAS